MHASTPNALAANGRLAASGSEDGVIKLWAASSLKCTRSFQASEQRVCALALGSGLLMVSGHSRCIKLWDARHARSAWEQRCTAALDEAGGTALALSGGLLYSAGSQLGGSDASVRVWDLRHTRRTVARLAGHVSQVNALAASSDGGDVYSGDRAGKLRVWSQPG